MGLSCPILLVVPREAAYSNVRSVMPVSMSPGQIEFTRMSLLRSWYADVCAMLFTLCRGQYVSRRAGG